MGMIIGDVNKTLWQSTNKRYWVKLANEPEESKFFGTLELGKTYLLANGERVTIDRTNGAGAYWDSTNDRGCMYTWHKHGTQVGTATHLDIIGEIPCDTEDLALKTYPEPLEPGYEPLVESVEEEEFSWSDYAAVSPPGKNASAIFPWYPASVSVSPKVELEKRIEKNWREATPEERELGSAIDRVKNVTMMMSYARY